MPTGPFFTISRTLETARTSRARAGHGAGYLRDWEKSEAGCARWCRSVAQTEGESGAPRATPTRGAARFSWAAPCLSISAPSALVCHRARSARSTRCLSITPAGWVFHQSAKQNGPTAHVSCYCASREESQTGAAVRPLAESLSLCRCFLAPANRPHAPDGFGISPAEFRGHAFLQ